MEKVINTTNKRIKDISLGLMIDLVCSLYNYEKNTDFVTLADTVNLEFDTDYTAEDVIKSAQLIFEIEEREILFKNL